MSARAGPSRINGGQAGHVITAAHLSGRLIVVGLVCVALVAGVLWVPVLSDRLTDSLTRNAPRYAPRMFFIGLAFLLTGLVVRVLALDIVGACLIGLLLLGLFIDNY